MDVYDSGGSIVKTIVIPISALDVPLSEAPVLFLGYGWPILAGWTAVGLWFARAHEGKPATAAKAAA